MKEFDAHIIQDQIDKFSPISLKEMDSIKLLNRTDTKFVFNVNHLPAILNDAKDHYRILEINNKRIMEYKTIYYDTEDNKLYTAHQNGKLNRYKVRQREYVDSDIYFIEIKYKTNKSRTIKSRTKIDNLEYELSKKSKKFIQKNMPINADDLKLTLINRFSRFTLTNIEKKERITIDLNLKYVKDTLDYRLPYITIAEIKQDGFSNSSEFVKILRKHRIRPTGMSKFCIGVLHFNEHLKYNNFKTRLLKINKIKNEQYIA